MLENIKLDIIYYRTPKDFEMEFNLCGCCRMRLLNSIADDIKSLINCMKLAVARSKVIILCGEINGENNLFEIVSKAIGRESEEIENSLYGISTPGTTRLMKNSIPLITKAGVLFGCVVEQGPQSIVIVSTDKQQRREIMHDLVHPYITELSRVACIKENLDETNENISYEPDAQETVTEQDEPVLDCSAPVNPETMPVCEDITTEQAQEDIKGEIGEIAQEQAPTRTEISEDEYTAEMLLDTEKEQYDVDKTFDYDSNPFPLIHTVSNADTRDRTRHRSKHSKKQDNSPLLLILICILLCLIGILGYFLVLKPLMSGISINENFRQLIPFLSWRLIK